MGFRCLEKLGSEIHFCFENESDPVPELMISRQKIDYWLSFLVVEVRRQDKHAGYPPNSLFNFVAGIQRLIHEQHQLINLLSTMSCLCHVDV